MTNDARPPKWRSPYQLKLKWLRVNHGYLLFLLDLADAIALISVTDKCPVYVSLGMATRVCFSLSSPSGTIEPMPLFLQWVQMTVIALHARLGQFPSLLREPRAGPTSAFAEDRCSVIGARGSGKTSVSITSRHSVLELICCFQFVNVASGSSLRVGTGRELCTTEVQLSNEFVVDGRKVVLIDTPGFDDVTQSDTNLLEMITAFVETM